MYIVAIVVFVSQDRDKDKILGQTVKLHAPMLPITELIMHT